MAADITPPIPQSRHRLRRVWILVILVLFPIVVRVLLTAAHHYDFGEGAVFNLTLVFQIAFTCAFFGVFLWFFFLSGLPSQVRVGGAVVLAAAIAMFFLTVERVEFDGDMRPQLYWRWQPSPEQRLGEHRATTTQAVEPADLTISPTDSPEFRGRNRNGEVTGVRLISEWTTHPPKLLWKQPCGGGHAGFAVAGNSAVTIEQIGEEEVIVCYDRVTGQERWRHGYTAKFKQTEPMGGDGPRATPTIADGDVYSLGATGELICLNGSDGTVKWQVNILTDNEADNIDWGMTGSPLVIDNMVVVNPGRRKGFYGKQAVAAYDRTTGKKIWAAGMHRAGYASPMKATLDGYEQILVFDAGGLAGYDPEDGEILWYIHWKSPMDMNSAQPLILGPNRVLISSEKDNGAAVFHIAKAEAGGWVVAPVWNTRRYAARYASPVLHDNHIYGLTDGALICLEAETGQVKWKDGMFKNGQILIVGDLLVVTHEAGSVHLIAADPNEFRELGSISVFKDRTWNMPALAGNQLFLRNHREMACLELQTRD
jgi:outer membrane protein assembly factor BamB